MSARDKLRHLQATSTRLQLASAKVTSAQSNWWLMLVHRTLNRWWGTLHSRTWSTLEPSLINRRLIPVSLEAWKNSHSSQHTGASHRWSRLSQETKDSIHMMTGRSWPIGSWVRSTPRLTPNIQLTISRTTWTVFHTHRYQNLVIPSSFMTPHTP